MTDALKILQTIDAKWQSVLPKNWTQFIIKNAVENILMSW